MRERNYGIDGAAGRDSLLPTLALTNRRQEAVSSGGKFFLEAAYDFLADAVHAPYGGNDPYLVADTHLAVGAAETAETALLRRLGNLYEGGGVAIVQQTLEIGLDTTVVDHRACLRRAGDVADGKAVLDDILPLGEVVQDNLMPSGYVGLEAYPFYAFTCLQVLQGHGYVVVGIYLYVLHKYLNFGFLDFARNDRIRIGNSSWRCCSRYLLSSVRGNRARRQGACRSPRRRLPRRRVCGGNIRDEDS